MHAYVQIDIGGPDIIASLDYPNISMSSGIQNTTTATTSDIVVGAVQIV